MGLGVSLDLGQIRQDYRADHFRGDVFSVYYSSIFSFSFHTVSPIG